MEKFLTNNIFITFYFFIVGLIGLYTKTFFKKLIEKYNIFNVMLIEAVIGLIVLLPIAVYLVSSSKFQYLKIIKNITQKEIALLFILNIFGVITGYIGSSFVKKNQISKLIVLDIVIGIFLSFIGMYFFENKTISKKNIFGLIFICVGAYLML